MNYTNLYALSQEKIEGEKKMNKAINERVKKYRNFAGLSQEEVAKKLNIKTSTYSQMERNGNISAQTIMNLAAIFDVSPITLMYDENDPFARVAARAMETPVESSLNFESPRITIDENGNFVFPEYQPSRREIDFLKTIKSLPKTAQQEILDFVQKKFDENK